MLRFDVPAVPANVIRFEAFVTSLICCLALLLTPWLMALLVVQGLVRGLFGHHRCPSHLVWKKVFSHQGWEGAMENAGAKMFANKILLLASGVALALFLAGSALWVVPTIALIVFSFLEWAFRFCAACWVYALWYQRFPPSDTANPSS
ncbi:MAG: DUF4395 domain-containing protein [Wenzhouxiangella sp.]|nr:MAG: DUF4395 domain-containing protein [Wenzhouxiangella sp.]